MMSSFFCVSPCTFSLPALPSTPINSPLLTSCAICLQAMMMSLIRPVKLPLTPGIARCSSMMNWTRLLLMLYIPYRKFISNRETRAPFILGSHLGILARKWHSATVTGDVVLELVDNELLLGDNVFNQIADGNQADELALVDDRKVPQPVFRHKRHTFLACLIRTHIHYRGRHNVAHDCFCR